MQKAIGTKTLDEIQNEVADWGESTFPETSFAAVRAHLTEEVFELWGLSKVDIAALLQLIAEQERIPEHEVDFPKEIADVQLLVFHLARRANIVLSTWVALVMAENRARIWNTTAEPAGHFKHIQPTEGTPM